MFSRATRCASKKNRSRLRGVQLGLGRDSAFSEDASFNGDFSILSCFGVFASHGGPSAWEYSGINSWVLEVGAIYLFAVCELDAECPYAF